MTSTNRNQYIPNEVSPPRHTLRELLEEREMSQADLAKRTGKTVKAVNELLSDTADVSITPETALQFERALGLPARFWLSREQDYQEAKARLREQERLENELDWLDRIPVTDLRKRGYVSSSGKNVDTLREILSFFGVASVNSWKLLWSNAEVSYRMSSAFQSEIGHVAAWLRCGELAAGRLECAPYNPKGFEGTLHAIRALATAPANEIFRGLVDHSAAEGVAVVLIPEFPKTRASGAARWLNGGRQPVIQLSLRYKTDDHFWFTFFHEACHILKHAKRPIYLDDQQDPSGARIEDEANCYARHILIPDNEYRAFVQGQNAFYSKDIVAFAKRIGIAPGVVAGRLQHDRLLDRKYGNSLKRSFTFDAETKVVEKRKTYRRAK